MRIAGLSGRRFTVGTAGVACNLGVIVSISAPTEVLAQTPGRDPVGAEALFRQGVAAKKRNDWENACDKFRKSMELDPAVSTQFKIASCDEHVGKLATAWYEYRTAQTMNRETGSEKRRNELEKSIKGAIDALEPRVPALRINVSPTDPKIKLDIERDDLPVAPASVLGEALPIDPGEHVIIVRSPGFLEQRIHVTVIEGKTVEAAITLVPVSATAPGAATTESLLGPTPPSSEPVPQRPPRKTNDRQILEICRGPALSRNMDVRRRDTSGQKQAAVVIGGTGAITLGVAGFYGMRTWWFVGKMNDHRKPDGTYDSGVYGPHDAATRSQTTGFVLAGVGAALTGLGIALYATAPSPGGVARSAAAPRFVVGFAPAAAFARGEW